MKKVCMNGKQLITEMLIAETKYKNYCYSKCKSKFPK